MRRAAALFIIILLADISAVQANDFFIGVKYFGLSIHPNGTYNSELMPLKFDKKGILILNTGAAANAEYFIYKDKFSLSTSFVPGFPDLANLSVGLRVKL